MITKIYEFLDYNIEPKIITLDRSETEYKILYEYEITIDDEPDNILGLKNYIVIITLFKKINTIKIDYDLKKNILLKRTGTLTNKFNMPMILANVSGVIKKWALLDEVKDIELNSIILATNKSKDNDTRRYNIYKYYMKKLGIKIINEIDITEEHKNSTIQQSIIKLNIEPILVKDLI
jgi:hypothetical protein